METRILGGFLKNDEFGLGERHALRLQISLRYLKSALPGGEGPAKVTDYRL